MANPNPQKTAAPAALLLRLPDVCQLLSLGRTSIYQKVKDDPTFPRPVKLTDRAVAWRRADLEAWVAGLSPDRTPTDVKTAA